MDKCHLIEVILSCIWRMFVPSTDQDKQDDDDDDESILKTHPLASMSFHSEESILFLSRKLPMKTRRQEWSLMLNTN